MSIELVLMYFGAFTLVIVGIILYAFRRLLYIIEVDGCSMAPYLKAGDRVLIMRYFPKSLIRRGSVVLLEPWLLSDLKGLFIKRIVGLPNDTLAIYETELIALKDTLSKDIYDYYSSIYAPNTVVTYLTRVPDPNFSQINLIYSKRYKTEKVPPGYVFVKGDWLLGGDDSIIHGPILYKNLIGVMLMKLDRRGI